MLVDESVPDKTFELKVGTNGKLTMPIEDPKDTITYILNHKSEIGYDTPKYYNEFTSIEGNPSIFIEIPNAFTENKAREFAVVLNKHVNDRDITLKFQYDATPKYKFFMNGVDVSDGLVLHDDKTILKFLEIKKGIFTIDEISNTDYFNVLTISALTGYIDVLSVAKTATISSETVVDSKISSLVVTDLTGSSVSAVQLTADTVNISTENVLTSTVGELTATKLSADDVTMVSVNISTENVTTAVINELTATMETVTNLTGTNISGFALTADNVNISTENVVSADVEKMRVNKLTAQDEDFGTLSGSNLTVLTASISSLDVSQTNISGLTATVEFA